MRMPSLSVSLIRGLRVVGSWVGSAKRCRQADGQLFRTASRASRALDHDVSAARCVL
jgi:hypothetical protein